MPGLSTFVLVGTIISHDSVLTTIEFQTNPPSNGGPSIAVMPVEAIPCDIKIGTTIYVVKQEFQEVPTIICKKEEK
ncbi:MAG: hypothetical protein H8E12_11240 [Rhodobacteraceae bacterium]|nr:hypothetical protein [Paracoccaceae bacterium]